MLTVVTHTRGERPELLARTVASVEAALVPGVAYRIIECKNNWAQARLAASMEVDEYVAFVDDDDTIDPWVLAECLDAIRDTRVGLVFTEERKVDISGNVLHVSSGRRTYLGIGTHPKTAHHLSCICAQHVDPRALDLNNKYGLGIDWTIVASAAFQGGAVHIPRPGYNWTQHSVTMNREEQRRYSDAMFNLGNDIRNLWPRQWGRVPLWEGLTK